MLLLMHSSIQKLVKPYSIHEVEIYVDISLEFTIRIFGWLLKDDHEIYLLNRRSVRNITLSNLILAVENYKICEGIQFTQGTSIQTHTVPILYYFIYLLFDFVLIFVLFIYFLLSFWASIL